MLNSQYPEVTEWGKYLEQLSECKSFTSYTWNQGPGHPQPAKKDITRKVVYPFLGPIYKTPTNLILYEADEMNLSTKSHCSVDPCYTQPKDTRFSKEGVIKGLVQRSSNPNGPGYYTIPEEKRGAAGFTFEKATMTPDKVRAKSVATVVPPPGTYDVKGMFDPSSDEEDDQASRSHTSKSTSSKSKGKAAKGKATSSKPGSSAASSKPAEKKH